MSFILDALKKSEAERQRQAGPALLEMRIVRPTRRLPPWAVIVGVVLVGCVLALAWVALRRGAASGSASTTAPAAATSASPASAVGAPAGANAGVVRVPQSGANVPAAGQPVASALATGAQVAPAAAATIGAPAPQPAAANGEENPADVEPAEAPSGSVTRAQAAARELRNYSELGGATPELRLDLHVYAAKPAERYALINMHKVREGDVTAEGVTVREITPDGVVLEYHGTEFLLGR
jgi:general secretion pathway protein B